jgi:L-amino acid N-acyltransferase YncA
VNEVIETRLAKPADAEAINDIYNYYVLNSVVTFDIDPSEVSYWQDKIEHLAELGLPFLVAESEGEILGFAYASPWRPKAAYRQTVEDTIYLSPKAIRQGLGSRLLAELIEECRKAKIKEMIAVISAEGAEASVAIHEGFGFVVNGRLTNVGYKFERWLGTVLMQKSL